MIRHAINPSQSMLDQARRLGFPEPLPYQQTILYRFFDVDDALLYVGVTKRPSERWTAHRRTSAWWPSVAFLAFEIHPHDRAALDAETAAIRTELPLFNKRSAPAFRRDSSRAAHAPLTRYSRVVLPRVGGGVGVGGRGGSGAIHASRLTSRESRPVDNGTAATTTDRLGWMTASRSFGGGC